MRIGIDLGGTNTAAVIVDESGVIIGRATVRTNAGSTGSVIEGLLSVCDALLATVPVKPESFGIGVPGTVNAESGEVIFTPNLPLSGVNITRELQKKYSCPIRLGNDANCAALGEAVAGGARGVSDVILITLGTGIGGGIIVGGKLHTGLSGAAGELGHMVIVAGGRECGCGRKGCWETYASATGLKRTAKEFMELYDRSILWDFYRKNNDKVSGKTVFVAQRMGDAAAILAVDSYIGHLASGIVNLINILEPETVCLGGGISNEWETLAGPLQEKIDAERYPNSSADSPRTRIVRAELGNDAGLIGAAMLK